MKISCSRGFFFKVTLSYLFVILAYGTAKAEQKNINPTSTPQGQKPRGTRTALIALEKVTVGPDDSYQNHLHPDQSKLVFTQKSNMAPHVFILDLKSGKQTPLTKFSADAQEARFSPDGTRILYVSYAQSANGQICVTLIHDDSPAPCYTYSLNPIRTPFWISNSKIGYLVQTNGQEAKVIMLDLQTKNEEVLLQGRIWAPSSSADGKILVYSRVFEDDWKRHLVVYNLEKKIETRVNLDLPGFPGFAAAGNGYLYFSHYLNDTNGDLLIDANDNSLIFRLPLKSIDSQKAILPEQLTALDTHCNYPDPQSSGLFVSCAFEGAVNIYRLPLTGVIPADWNQATLENAHQTSRSYDERLLLLNALRVRSKSIDQTSTLEKVVSNHFFNQEFSAALYYIAQLTSQAKLAQTKPTEASFYKLLEIYAKGYQLEQLYREQELSRTFQQKLTDLIAQTDLKDHKQHRLSGIVKAHLYFLQGAKDQALRQLDSVVLTTLEDSFSLYIYSQLAESLFDSSKKTDSLAALYLKLTRSKFLSHESQVYYLFQYLSTIHRAGQKIPERIHPIENAKSMVPSELMPLIEAEVLALKICQSQNKDEKRNYFNQMGKIIENTRNDYFLRKALYIRSILTFLEFDEYLHSQAIASNWLKFTDPKDTEFTHARNQYLFSELDRAYYHFSKSNFSVSAGHFYGALSLVDDLEAHTGFIVSRKRSNEIDLMNRAYNDLKKRAIIGENKFFVEAFLLLYDQPAQNEPIDQAISLLNQMETNTAVRHLFLGYCYLNKLRLNQKGPALSSEFLTKAHHHLNVSYDLALDNDRLRASILNNLSLTHLFAKNYALSAQYFERRWQIPFEDLEEKRSLAWYFAKALYYTDLPLKSVEILSSVPANGETASLGANSTSWAWTERLAFYSWYGGKYSEAKRYYDLLLKQAPSLTPANWSKIYLSYGAVLFRLDQKKEALSFFRKSLAITDDPKNFSSHPLNRYRIQLIALGLAARCEVGSAAIGLLEQRAKTLSEVEPHLDLLAIKKAGWYEAQLHNQLNLAELYLQNRFLDQASEALHRSLAHAVLLGKENEEYLGRPLFEALQDYLLLAVAHPKKATSWERADDLFEKLESDFSKIKTFEPLIVFRYLKLALLRLGSQQSLKKVASPSESFSAILSSKHGKKLAESSDPAVKKLHTNLVNLAENLKNL